MYILSLKQTSVNIKFELMKQKIWLNLQSFNRQGFFLAGYSGLYLY